MLLLATLTAVLEASALVVHQRVSVIKIVMLWETAVKTLMIFALKVCKCIKRCLHGYYNYVTRTP